MNDIISAYQVKTWDGAINMRGASFSRRVLIANLPNGIFKDRLLRCVTDPQKVAVWTIATIDTHGGQTVRVTIGHPSLRLDGGYLTEYGQRVLAPYMEQRVTLEGTKSWGDTVGEDEARILFPELMELARGYRT